MNALDRRLNAFRDDLADIRLQGRVEAPRFAAGRPARIGIPVADMRRQPRPDAGLDTQLLMGAGVRVFDEQEGWAWVQADADGYVGYVGLAALAGPGSAPTHRVAVPRTFVYPGPDLKLPMQRALSMGSSLHVVGEDERRGTRYALLDGGEAVIASHLVAVAARAPDYVAVAERLLHTPYLWGGTSGFGIDCSGLTQLSMAMAGMAAPRDSDMQASGLGAELEPGAPLRRGDLVFWKGHVAILTDPQTILHANGHTMSVASEPLAEAVERIGYLYGQPTGYRRP